MAYKVLQTIPLDDKCRRYRVWIVGSAAPDCFQRYIDVGTMFSWNGPTTGFELGIDAGGHDPRFLWCNGHPSDVKWSIDPSPRICSWKCMNPTFQKIDLDGSCTTVRTFLCGTYRDNSGQWGKSSGDQYVDVISSGGVTELNFNLWQRNGKGGPEDKDYFGIWISGYSSTVDWYDDVTICGWQCIPPPAVPEPPAPGCHTPAAPVPNSCSVRR